MRKMKIIKDINELHEKYFDLKLALSKSLILLYFYNHKYIFYITCLFIIIFLLIFEILYNKTTILSKSFKKYIKDCKKLILYNRNKIYNKFPYISICISILNIETFIERNLLSIINQSYQDFEIIIVNVNSNDETENIIKKIQLNEDRIKLISHSEKIGIYRTRIESIFNSKGKYILLLDSKDMYLNEDLFKELYNYNMKYNLDIIEFSVFQQIEGSNKIFELYNELEVRFVNFNNNIIYQPELSDILFNLSSSYKNSPYNFKSIYNKLIRKNILIKIINYIGKEYYHEYIISTDDMIMNILSHQYAINYSNIKLICQKIVERIEEIVSYRSGNPTDIRPDLPLVRFQPKGQGRKPKTASSGQSA